MHTCIYITTDYCVHLICIYIWLSIIYIYICEHMYIFTQHRAESRHPDCQVAPRRLATSQLPWRERSSYPGGEGTANLKIDGKIIKIHYWKYVLLKIKMLFPSINFPYKYFLYYSILFYHHTNISNKFSNWLTNFCWIIPLDILAYIHMAYEWPSIKSESFFPQFLDSL